MNSESPGSPVFIRPKQREKLELIQLYEDGVVFDPIAQSGISLNSSARRIWDLSDGTRTIEEITQAISEQLGVSRESSAFRDLDFDIRSTLQMFENHHLVRMLRDDRTFSCSADLPRMTTTGFEVIDLPDPVRVLIEDLYRAVISGGSTTETLGTEDAVRNLRSELFPLDQVPEKRDQLFPLLQPIHEEWCGEALDPAAIYGMRSYLPGAQLFRHRDTVKTHHVSSIFMVEKNLATEGKDEPAPDWPLEIQAHDGSWHEVYLKPGQAVLYESATSSHGREQPFEGTFYRNFYVHFTLRHWEYVG